MERNYAKLQEDICYGRAGGKVLWQPRIGCWWADKMFHFGELSGRYKGMSMQELYRDLGCSARVYEYTECFIPVYDESIRFYSEFEGDDLQNNYIETPLGTVFEQWKSTPNSYARIRTKWYISTEEDMKIYTYIEAHTDWRYDP